MPGDPVELDEVGVGDGADVQVLQGLPGQREELRAEAVAAVGLAVDEAVLVQGAQQAQGRALVHAELLGDVAEPRRPLREQRQDPQRPLHRLTHAMPFRNPTHAAGR